jgi:hypothetical protein
MADAIETPRQGNRIFRVVPLNRERVAFSGDFHCKTGAAMNASKDRIPARITDDAK